MNLRGTAKGIQGKWSHLRPHSVQYYLKSRIHRKIGAFATRRYFQVFGVVAHDINMLASELNMSAMNISDSMAGIISRPYIHPLGEDTVETKSKEEKENDEKVAGKRDLDEAVRQSNEVLAEATSVFPFTLFPDTMTVDRTKLTITQRTFFLSSKVMTIHIEDVLNLSVQTGPLFGSLTIAIKGLTSEDHFSMNYFWRKDAIHLKHIIQGHTIARRDKIDYKSMEKQQLIDTLIKLGKDSHP